MDLSPFDAQVNELLAKMTLEEKVGQLAQFSDGMATGPNNLKIDQVELARRGLVGSMLNVTGAAAVNALQRVAIEESRLGIPILFALDVIHGYRTVYPIPLALSCSWNAALAEECARMAAVEATSVGIRWTFSPMVDIARDARWGRITEGNGEDTFLGTVLAKAWVRGFQGTDLKDPQSMLACAKHYVAYGAAEGGREYDLVDISNRTLWETYLPPFEACVEAGAATFMSGFNLLQGVSVSANPYTLKEILRETWGFQGLVVSDWNSVGELIPHGLALDGEQAAFKGLTAGVDMDMMANLYNSHLAELVESGKLDVAVIDASVRRVLGLKFALGLFENPYTDEGRADGAILAQAHRELARRAAEESFVLIKNDAVEPAGGGAPTPLLPLSVEAGQTVALIGPLGDSAVDMLGAWNMRGLPEDVVTLRSALAEKLGDKLVYAPGTGITEECENGFNDALAAAAEADLVIMALGETFKMSGEAASRTRLDIPPVQGRLLRQVVETGTPVVLVLFNGRPLELPWETENVPAILEAWFPGVQAGPALVRTLFGETAPTGRLTTSFPRTVGQMPLYYNRPNTGRPATGLKPGEGYITGYIDERNTPLHPFGWGLTYTTFQYTPTEILPGAAETAAALNGAGTITVKATVTNTGGRAGVEVVQLYTGQRGTSISRPVRELKGFERVVLEAGESREVSFTVGRKELAFWNIEMRQVVEPCELRLWIAPHSEGGVPAVTRVR
jgi:beta-glucosidase